MGKEDTLPRRQTVSTADLRTLLHCQDLKSELQRKISGCWQLFSGWFQTQSRFLIIGQERGHSMLSSLKTLLLLSVLCAPTSSLCLRLYQSRADLLCNNQMALGDPSEESNPGYSPVDAWASLLQSADYLSSSAGESSREKRTSSPANYRFMSRTKLRGQMLRNNIKGDRRSRLTLSLDVPTNIMNVLFDVAKAKNLRAKAAENARLLAQIGRRK